MYQRDPRAVSSSRAARSLEFHLANFSRAFSSEDHESAEGRFVTRMVSLADIRFVPELMRSHRVPDCLDYSQVFARTCWVGFWPMSMVT